jgi:hypothetical protein
VGPRPNRASELAALSERITAVLTRPDELRREASLWSRWSARWRASDAPLEAGAVRALAGAPIEADRWDALVEPVIAELARNVERAERLTLAGAPPPTEELAWLADLAAWLERVEGACERPHRFAQLTTGLGARRGGEPRPRAASARGLARVEAILDEAAVETSRRGRRRRLLEAARRSLLDVEDSLGDEGTEVVRAHALSACITRELMEASRLEALGVSLERDLDTELRARLARRDPGAAAIARALAWLDTPRARLEAIDRLASGAPRTEDATHDVREPMLSRLFERARERIEHRLASAPPAEAMALRRHRRSLEGEAVQLLLGATRLADALLETGGGLSQARFLADDRALDVVRTPAERMHLLPAQGVDDLAAAVIDDPRRLLHQLASGELLTRRYVRPRQTDRRQGGPSAEVRLFLLDGSSSMQGARARMRDAVILAEIAALAERLSRGGRARQLLYYRFFHDESEPLRRVRTLAEASEAMLDVIATERSGGTDLEGAIADALRELEWAEKNDVALTRAQIVLVSDGEASVDPEVLHALAESLGVPLRLSIVALGDDGPSLRSLADAQRRRGARVFHHHLSDAALEAWQERLAPTLTERTRRSARELALEEPLPAPTLEAGAPEDPRVLELALAEVALEGESLEAHTRVRLEALRRDVRALEARFDRFFPAIASGPTTTGTHDAEELAFALDALASLESLDDPSASRLDRMSDAIALLVRLLARRGITPRRWDALLATHGARLREPIQHLRARCAQR